MSKRYSTLAAILLFSSGILFSSTGVSAVEVDFSRDIRPILSDKCFRCHGPDAGNREADLRLDLRDVAVELGAIAPGDPGGSELIDRLLSDDPDTMMPPPATDKKILSGELKLLSEWIEQGAQYSEHWAFTAQLDRYLPLFAIRRESAIRSIVLYSPGWKRRTFSPVSPRTR